VDPFETLAPLAAAATVRIHPPPAGYDGGEPGSRPWGSGFFVSPSWVLTCAHVALRGGSAEGGRREVGLVFGDIARPVTGVVEWARPEEPPVNGRWPAPDLALIRLLEPVRHDCAWLTERTAAYFTPGNVAFFGCAEENGRIERISGRCTIQGELGSEGELKLGNQDEIPEGASGGPLVDLEHGEVIGVVKAHRSAGRDGGLGVSVLQLRRLPEPARSLLEERDDTYHRVLHAHDRYHADQYRDTSTSHDSWIDAQTSLPLLARRALKPGQRAALLALLAELPPPASTRQLGALINEVRGRPYQGLLPAPRGWRDGAGLLYDPPGRGELETVLRYAVHAATADHPFPAAPGAEDRLLTWAHDTAADLGLPHWIRTRLREEQRARLRARPDVEARFGRLATSLIGPGSPGSSGSAGGEPPLPQPFVLLEITQRAWEPDCYDWLVYAPQPTGELTAIDADSDAQGYDQPPRRLCAALTEAFRRCDEADRAVMLLAALPYRLLGLPLDEWRISGPPGPRLGDERAVVVRCVSPDPSAQDSPRLRKRRDDRWRRLHTGAMRPWVLDCEGGHPQALPEPAHLAANELDTLPVLCRAAAGGDAAPDPDALYRVLTSGHDVVLWRREIAPHGPNCADFHRGVTRTAVQTGHAGALPGALRRLRADAGGGAPEAYWSIGLALHYADPGQPLPGADDFLEAP
jgi:hypothetical protein